MGLIVLCKSQTGAFISSGFWTTAAQDLEVSGCWGFGQPHINGAGLGAAPRHAACWGMLRGGGTWGSLCRILAPGAADFCFCRGKKKAAYCQRLDNVVWLCREEGERQEEEALFTRRELQARAGARTELLVELGSCGAEPLCPWGHPHRVPKVLGGEQSLNPAARSCPQLVLVPSLTRAGTN